MSVMSAHSAAQAPTKQEKEEREIDDRIPKNVPIKVKIKSEKEKGFRDLKNSKWLRDLEVEVTNLSEKPIYFLELWVDMPEIISANGHKVGFTLRYGRIEFVHFSTLPLPSDVPIQPGPHIPLRSLRIINEPGKRTGPMKTGKILRKLSLPLFS